jgi:hypothetical protein
MLVTAQRSGLHAVRKDVVSPVFVTRPPDFAETLSTPTDSVCTGLFRSPFGSYELFRKLDSFQTRHEEPLRMRMMDGK